MLKSKSLWTCLILMIILLQSSAGITYGELPDGYFDTMDGNAIVGWGWKSSEPNNHTQKKKTTTKIHTNKTITPPLPLSTGTI